MNLRVLCNSIFNSRRSVIWILSFECAHCLCTIQTTFLRDLSSSSFGTTSNSKRSASVEEKANVVWPTYIFLAFLLFQQLRKVCSAHTSKSPYYNTRRVFCLQPHTGRIKWCLSLGYNAIWSMHEREMDTDRQGPSTRDGFVLVLPTQTTAAAPISSCLCSGDRRHPNTMPITNKWWLFSPPTKSLTNSEMEPRRLSDLIIG